MSLIRLLLEHVAEISQRKEIRSSERQGKEVRTNLKIEHYNQKEKRGTQRKEREGGGTTFSNAIVAITWVLTPKLRAIILPPWSVQVV